MVHGINYNAKNIKQNNAHNIVRIVSIIKPSRMHLHIRSIINLANML